MLTFMKNKILIPLLIIGALAAFFSFKYVAKGSQSSAEKRKLAIEAVVVAMEHEHYSPRQLDDSFSSKTYHKLFDWMDNRKLFFTKQDMKQLSAYEFSIDDQIKNRQTVFFDSFEAIYLRRTKFVEQFYQSLLEKPFSFNGNEKVVTDPAIEDYADGEQGLKDKWMLNLKYWTLIKYVEFKEEQDKKLIDSPKMKTKTDAEFEVAAREDIKKMYGRIFKRMNKVKPDERFTTYVNAIAETQDPHTTYLPPVDKKSFDEMMSGSFFGIGAQLKENPDDGKITITSIVTGSPSWKQGELKADDEIQKVAQGENTPVNVTGFELNDVVKLIRGEKGTEVRLTVKKPDGTIKVIPIIRGVVSLEETFAKSAIINSPNGRIGYVFLPEFYADFNHTSGRRCAIDVQEEVKKLKAEGVKGIILDLRGNGGGSLQDVVEMGGTFVGKGPMVQVKNNQQAVSILRSQSVDSPVYTGPLIIMVNQGSASASEILAAAMQDYKRAVIVGAPTFGKGTVQKMVPLDELLPPMTRLQLQNDTNNSDPSIGSLKLTMEKFYRISGGSTQLKGVTPDIILPSPSDYLDDEDMGERRYKSALPYDEINAASYKPMMAYTDVNDLAARCKKRVGNNPIFNLIDETNELRKKKMEEKVVVLNEKQYRKEQESLKSLTKRLDEMQKKATLLEIVNPRADVSKVNIDSVTMTKNKDWLKNVSKDIYIAESVNILNDLAKGSMSVQMDSKK